MLRIKISVSKKAVSYEIGGNKIFSLLPLLRQCFSELNFSYEDEKGDDIIVSIGCHSLSLEDSKDIPKLFDNTVSAKDLRTSLEKLLKFIRDWYDNLPTSEEEFDF